MTMRRNILGRTGLEVSVLGLGGHEYRWLHAGNIAHGRQLRFNPERAEVVATARERGINFFDTTFHEEVQSLGHVLAQIGGRDDIIINGMITTVLRAVKDMTPSQADAFIRDELHTRLDLLGSHFDIFMLCAIEHGYDRHRAEQVVEIYQRHRDAGAFRFIGASCHSYTILADFLRMKLPVDVVMFPYNFATTHEQHMGLNDLLAVAAEENIGMIAIKPICWTMYRIPFTAVSGEWHDIQKLIRQSLAWHASVGATHTTMVGVETVADIENNAAGPEEDCDERLLLPYLGAEHRLDLLARNGLRHSEEVQHHIVRLCRKRLGRDLGDDLNAYLGQVS